MNITRNLITAVLMTIVTTVILGIIYPLAITGIAQVAFPHQANGQLIERDGKVIGSSLIAPGVLVAGVLPPAAVGGRHGLRRGELGRQPARSDEQEAGRRRQGQRRGGARGESERGRAHRPRHDVGVGRSIRTSRRPRRTSRFRVWRANAASPRRTSGVSWRRTPPAGRLASLARPVSTCSSSTSRSMRSTASRDSWPLMPEQRPTADALLARLKEQERARLRVYIGAAPGRGQDLRDAAGGACASGARPRRGRRHRRDLRPARHGGAAQGSRSHSATQDRVPRRHARGDGRRRHHPAQAAGLRDRRAGAHQRARQPECEAVPGRARDPRCRHPRDDGGEHPAPRNPRTTRSPGRPACACAKRCPTRSSTVPTKSSTSM